MLAVRSRRGLELTGDRIFRHRVRRLAAVSAVGLGVVWGLAYVGGAPLWTLTLLAVGWVLMPMTLAFGLDRPGLRRVVMLPAVLVPVALVGMLSVVTEATRTGWIVAIAGLGFGAFIGAWFWLRWLPVPRLFDDPFGWPRVGLVGIHIGLLLAGGALILTGL